MKIRWICLGLALAACSGEGGAPNQPGVDTEPDDASGDASGEDAGTDVADAVDLTDATDDVSADLVSDTSEDTADVTEDVVADEGDGGSDVAIGDIGEDTPPELASSFDEDSVRWDVPESGLSDGFGMWESSSTYRHWSLLDMDGDRRFDLVQTADPATNLVWDASGDPYWAVFLNDGEGFEDDAELWSVPPSGLSDGFYFTAVAGTGRGWVTQDLDGDGRPDLVHTMNPETGYVWDSAGDPYWNVYLNDGDGFDSDAIAWPVPDSGTLAGFSLANRTSAPYWVTVDMDGDELPDLVQTSDPGSGSVVWSPSDAPYWRVFFNEGEGFAAEAEQWPVPEEDGGGFYVTDLYAEWSTFDLDGDGLVDLVRTTDPATNEVWDVAGSPYWLAFLNTSSGFDVEGTQWTVPDSDTSAGFHLPFITSTEWSWRTVDINGDGAVDLVQSADPSVIGGYVWDASGNPYWKVFVNMGDGFDTSPLRWSVPDSGLSAGFAHTDRSSGSAQWGTFDIDGDGDADLVQTADWSRAGATVWDPNGAPYWRVFLAEL